ncbi:hypothetical protein R3P38DRAFT_3216049 [Favolaschia claudopus]|uniref:RING-type domain-containing protein n=1 Tax=Favolaschia claudopus TaxID=2862362 RepID=A0AAW0A7G4_9AGAR
MPKFKEPHLVQRCITFYFKSRAYTGSPKYLAFEGAHWFPIDVDAGTKDSPIDVDFWAYANDQEFHESGTSVKHVPAELLTCGICLDTLEKPRMPLCMHVFCGDCLGKWLEGQNKVCPVCRAPVQEDPIEDDALTLELAEAIADGFIAQRGS